ncbi:MAG: ATP-dependent zinc protease [Actinobacteria bacterium]|nr:ATP-dependent zinc protease [Actinomycetota bacterium]
MKSLPVLGWREWVSLPDHGLPWVKAKVDTGARTSALHATGLVTFERDGTEWVRFRVHPWQRSSVDSVKLEAPVLDRRMVRPSSGVARLRPVVLLPVRIGPSTVTVEFTLTRREQMGFRMLLGRQAIRGRFAVDPGRSYLTGRPPRSERGPAPQESL